MRTRTAICLAVGLAALAGTYQWAHAQATGFQRTILQRADLSAPGREGVMARADFAPGAAAGRHSHPGEEIAYVLEGTLSVQIEGKPAVTLKAGDVFLIPAGQIHDAKNIGTTPAKVVGTYVVEKGKPLATPAP